MMPQKLVARRPGRYTLTCPRRSSVRCRASATAQEASKLEATIIEAIKDVKGRGKEGLSVEQQAALDDAVSQLEQAGQGVQDPTTRADLLSGRWKLLYTSRPGTASPIQSAFTGTEAFSIFQEVRIDEGEDCRVNNVVEFGENASVVVLRVEAEASTERRPREGFTPRRGEGLWLFGKSTTGPPARDNMRIDFQFDQGTFNFRQLPFNIPYPVPFKYLGDETKGWIDITYLNSDGTFRLTRGNKGTLFVLTKSDDVVEELLLAVRDDDEERVLALITRLQGTPVVAKPAQDGIIAGKWRLKWSKQGESANALQRALVGQVKNWQIIGVDDKGNSTVENRVDLGFGVVRAIGKCKAESHTRTSVAFDKIILEAFGQEFPINLTRDSEGFVEWLYVDERVRITKGNRGSWFVHTRDADDA